MQIKTYSQVVASTINNTNNKLIKESNYIKSNYIKINTNGCTIMAYQNNKQQQTKFTP